MSDHSDGLETLDADLRDVAGHGARHSQGLPAGEVRRRGSRRRATRLAATSAAALILVVGGTALALGTGGETTTAPPATPPITGAQLVDTFLYHGEEEPGIRWEAARTTSSEDPEAPVSVCQRAMLTSLGATDVRVRTYDWVLELQPGEVDGAPGPDPAMQMVVARFADPAAAETAYRTVGRWVDDCAANVRRNRDGAYVAEPVTRFSEVAGPTGEGWTAIIGYPEQPEVDPDAAVIDPHAVGITADRTGVVLVSQPMLGQDYNAPPAEAPVTRMLAEELRLLSTSPVAR